MAKAVAVVIPQWVIDLRKQPEASASLYTMLPLVMQWRSLDYMKAALSQESAGTGVMFHLEHLFDQVRQIAAEKKVTHTLVARISLSPYLPRQMFLTIATDERRPKTIGSYVLRTTQAGKIEGVRMAAES